MLNGSWASWIGTAQRQQLHTDAQVMLGVAPQPLFDEGRGEPIETGFDRRMGGEEVAARVTARATSNGTPLSSMKHRARSNTAKAACLR